MAVAHRIADRQKWNPKPVRPAEAALPVALDAQGLS
jgi:hypothetical protein